MKELKIPLSEIFTNDFIAKYTRFSSLKNIFDTPLYKGDDKGNISDKDLPDFNRHIANNSNFSSWEEMMKQATVEYLKKNYRL